MELSKFNIMPKIEQYNRTHNEGTFVHDVTEGNLKYVLYSLHKFWVQIIYDSARNRQIEIRGFVSGDLLDRFSKFS